MNNAESCMAVTGRVATIFIVGAAGGEMVLPALTGQLFTGLGPKSLPWFLFVSCLVQCASFMVLAKHTAGAADEAATKAAAKEEGGGGAAGGSEVELLGMSGAGDDEDAGAAVGRALL